MLIPKKKKKKKRQCYWYHFYPLTCKANLFSDKLLHLAKMSTYIIPIFSRKMENYTLKTTYYRNIKYLHKLKN